MKHRVLHLFLLLAAIAVPGASHAATDSGASSAAVNVKKDAQKGISAINKLPKMYREALLAEVEGLLYMDNGSDPISNTTGTDKIKGEEIKYKRPQSEARFIGSDGKVYNFITFAREKMKKPKVEENWLLAKLYINHAGKDAVMQAFGKQIHQLALQRGIYCLKNLPTEYRDAFLAEACELLFLDNGESAISDVEKTDLIKGEKIPYKRVMEGARFTGTDGQVYDFLKLGKERHENKPKIQGLWLDAKYIMHRVGKEALLNEFAKEVALLREKNKPAE